MVGVVKWFRSRKGYGFITGSDGSDYFVHHTEICGKGYKTLKDGEKVKFDVGENHKGKMAINVKRDRVTSD